MHRIISTSNAPPPGGHYSQAVQAGGFLHVSGMLPGPPAPGEEEGIERQARAALSHCRAVVEAAGYGLADVVDVTVYIVGIGHWPRFNEIYAQFFGELRPARAVVPVPELHHGYLVEIKMVAFKG